MYPGAKQKGKNNKTITGVMTQEDKELLLKDICGRVPYKMRVSYTYAFAGAVGINGYTVEGILSYEKLQDFSLPNIGCEKRWVTCILPYLRPMSSMTAEEKNEYTDIKKGECNGCVLTGKGDPDTEFLLVDWLNAHHFDYRGLIKKGLALEAPEDMYK